MTRKPDMPATAHMTALGTRLATSAGRRLGFTDSQKDT